MNKLLLVKYGEISLKGKNRYKFENRLIKNIKNALQDYPHHKVIKIYGRLIVEVENLNEDIISKVQKVFGIISVSPAISTETSLEKIKEAALELLKDSSGETFKVSTRRVDKRFPMVSTEVSREVGAHLLINTEDWKVDLHNPDVEVFVEIRPEGCFVYTQGFEGFGGLPIGSSGRGVLMLSGGIDSPVAGWLSMKRGVDIIGLHFYSYPFTSQRSKEKVLELAGKLAEYKGELKIYINHFTEIQKEIRQKCPKDLGITIMRRIMFRIAERIAQKEHALALITGENLGQVASQTLESMMVINQVVTLPVLRPLVTMDKLEIIGLAQKINTYETSIQPFEDCCTIFLPENPAIKPKIERVLKAEENLEIDKLIEESLERTEVIIINKEELRK